MRTLLICHDDADLDRDGLARWLASFSTLAGILVVREPRRRLRQRAAREIRRVGGWRFLDVLAFRLYYALFRSRSDRRMQHRQLEWLRASFPESGSAPQLITDSPNTADAEAFVRECQPTLMLARCKMLLRERIFSKLGAEQDAYFLVDSTGVEFGGGGLHMALRDLARFGEAMRLDGRFNGQQIVPKAFVDDVRRGGDRQKFAPAGYKTLPGGSYHSMWWVLHNAHGAYSARGIHGQAIYVDPAAEMVIARFASHPLGGNVNMDPTSLPAYDAVANWLMMH